MTPLWYTESMRNEQKNKHGATLSFVRLARPDEVPERGTKMVWVDEQPLLLVRAEGTYYALQGLCNHQGKPLEGGTVWKGILDCPWHHFQWDIRTGENLFPKPIYPLERMPRLRDQVRSLRVYPVRIQDGYVEVGIPQDPAANDGEESRRD